MTNHEVLKDMAIEELGHFFCKTMESIGEATKHDEFCCDICPVKGICERGKNGFTAWLGKEHEE